MYWLMSIDALVRILVAMAVLFVAVPALARPARPGTTALERFFWNFGVGIALLTLAGQVLALANLFSLVTLLALMALVVLAGRAMQRGIGPFALLKHAAEVSFVAALNTFDKRVSIPRRLRRMQRRLRARLRAAIDAPESRRNILAWSILTIVAAAFRLYRPLMSANLGFSDTYVHLYILKLLQDGRQVDPEWGPYPRGLQFLLLAIHELTNVDVILLMNFFGVVVGVLMTLGVAWTARRLSGSTAAAFVAGLLFATLVGGPGQYFILGGAFSTSDPRVAATMQQKSYEELAATRGQFDIALTDFQRQTSTLSQELAIALLLPTALFLLAFFRTRERWQLAGYLGGTVSIAAVHSGVVIPLILLCALAAATAAMERRLDARAFRIAVGTGFMAVLVGSLWALAFIAYPYAGGTSHASMGTSVATAVLYYFPFLRPFAGDAQPLAKDAGVFVGVTPFLVACAILAIVWLATSLVRRREEASRFWIAAAFILFLLIHYSSRLGIPQLLEPVRNSQWLLMTLAVVLGMMAADLAGLLARWRPMRSTTATAVVVAPLLLLWATRVPRLGNPLIHNQIVDYSGYSGAALAVLKIGRDYEPYTWTLISYGQEFPMVLREGFHIPASRFLDQYDPSSAFVPIPTPHIFVIVEKTPHPFQIDNWARSFSRTTIEQRLQTWMHVYQSSHHNLTVFFEDEHVRVYEIRRTPAEIAKALAAEAGP